MFVLWADRKRTRYLVTMLPVAGLLTAFWTLPFLFGGAYMTDMTYERRPVGNAPNGLPDSYWQMLFPYAAWIDILVFALAAIGLVGCVIRGRRAGVFLGLVAVVFGTWACIWPQSHLWNARLLPFMYLARYLLAFIGVYEIVSLVVRHLRLELRDGAARTANEERRRRWGRRADGLASPTAQWGVGSGVLIGVVLASLIYGGIHFQRGLPFASFGVHNGKTTYDWLFFQGTKAAFVDDWARWNYSGYEGKPTWNEYRSIMSTMQDIGKEQGCGRALWEHQTGNDVSSYGTPMALMLLPFFTDGCIGSMEGLYFEASRHDAVPLPHRGGRVQAGVQPGPAAGLRQRQRPAGRPLHAGPRHPLLHGVPARRRRPGQRQPGPHAAAPGRSVDDLPGGRQRPGRAAHDEPRRREGREAERAPAAPR